MLKARAQNGAVPSVPRIHGVGAVVHDDAGRLLVVRRGRQPFAGYWSLPGGRVEPGEDDAAAVVREVAEETGIVVVVGALLGTLERPAPGGGVFDIRDYRCAVSGGALIAGDDATAVAWVEADELRRLPTTPGLLQLLAQWDALPN